MARGTIYDFTEKFGFHDGEGLEDRDFWARTELIKMLNANPLLQNYRAVAYDRPGMHNYCLIIFFHASGDSDEELLKQWLSDEIEEVLPDVPLALLEDPTPEELVSEAYDLI